VLPLHVLSLALSESFYDWLPWIIAGAILVLGLIVYGRRDLARLRPRRIWAISDVCFTEAIRKRVLWVTPLAIIGVIVVAQLSRPADAQDAIRQAVRAGMIPTLNQMTVVGIVSLPGMMTGQVLAGESPVDAVRYQIVIMFLIAAASALGTVGAVLLTYRRLFSPGHRFLRYRLEERV